MNTRDDTPTWRTITRIGIVVGIVAALVTIVGALRLAIGSGPGSGIPTATTAQVVHSATTPKGTATPTYTPYVAPTTAPTSPPPAPGTMLCESGANDDWNGWPATGQWHSLNGALLNDGSATYSRFVPSLIAPPSCEPTFPNYAVEARISTPNCQARGCFRKFGISARFVVNGSNPEGYNIVIWGFQAQIIDATNHTLASIDFSIGDEYHTYREEVSGNTVTMFIDGAKVLSVTDNQYLDTGQVGLWSEDTQLQVTDFKLIAL